ncbi:MAG: hypothetical protein HY881_22605 [Deltaproteobacteria bacterium]|nr:hypothetical protein [Deltaproteobacteria bacterium]
MNVNDYCNNVAQELTEWKTRLYDADRKFESLGCNVKEKMLGNLGDLRILIADMDERIDKLSNECSTEWGPIKKEFDTGYADLRSKYEETMDIIGRAAPVSIAG